MKKIAVMTVIALVAMASTALADDTLWARTYTTGANEQGRAVATIGTDIVVAGSAIGTTMDVIVVKYTDDGETAWVRKFDIDTMEQAVDIAIAPDSAIYVAVSVMSDPPAVRVIKLSKTGDTLWTRRRNGLQPTNLALDNVNAVYVWAAVKGVTPNDSLGLAKFNADGSFAWQKALKLGDMHRTAGCIIDKDGNVFAGATINDLSGMHSTLFKYTAAGDTVWTMVYPELAGAQITSLASDAGGNIIVLSSRGAELLAMRCLPDGSVIWNRPVLGQGMMDAYSSVAVDADSNLIIPVTDATQYCGLVKLTPDGQELWNGRTQIQGMLFGAAVDSDGRPIASGMAIAGGPPACLTIKFTGQAAVAEPRPPVQPSSDARLTGATILERGASLAVEIRNAGSYSVVLVDQTGAQVRNLHSGQLTAGSHTFKPGSLPAGTYYLKVTGPTGSSDTKLIQVR